MNPIILGVINDSGIVLTNVGKMKNYKKKIEMAKSHLPLMKKF